MTNFQEMRAKQGFTTSHCELCKGVRTVHPSGAVTEQHQQWCSELRRVSSTVLELQQQVDSLQRRVDELERKDKSGA